MTQMQAIMKQMSREQLVDLEKAKQRWHQKIQEQEREWLHKEKLYTLQLQIAEINKKAALAASQNSNPNSNSNAIFIQLIQKENKIADFKKKITIKNSKLIFKLKRSSNYDTWRNEALAQALAIEVKSILKNKKLICPDEITDDDAQIWEIKRKVSFNMLLIALKPAIQQVIKSQINENKKNAAEL